MKRLDLPPAAWLLLLLALTTALSAIKFGNGYIYDDNLVILSSTRIHDPTNIPRFFLHHAVWGSALGERDAAVDLSTLDTYRPVTMTTFALDSLLSGKAPWAYHLSNLLAHLGCTALLFALARRLLPQHHAHLAPLASAFFALHPLLTEAHVWINGRSDLYTTLFTLASLLTFTHAPLAPTTARKLGFALLAALSFFLAALSKEVSLLMLPFFPILMLLLPHLRPRLGTLALATAPLLVAAGGAVTARHFALEGLKAFGREDQLKDAVLRAPHLVMRGLMDDLAPTQTCFRYLYHEYRYTDNLELIVGAATLGALLTLLAILHRRMPLLLWTTTAFAATLAPAAFITTTIGWWGFNRYLYLPTALLAIGLVELLALLFVVLRQHGHGLALRALQIGLVVYFIGEAVLFVSATRSLHDEGTFYSHIVSVNPDSPHGHHGLGTLLLQPGSYEDAERHLKFAYDQDPNDARIRNNLLYAYLQLKKNKEMRELAEDSVALWSNNTDFHNYLGLSWVDEDPTLAASIFMESYRINTENVRTPANITWALNRLKDDSRFRDQLVHLTTHDPRYEPLKAEIDKLLVESPPPAPGSAATVPASAASDPSSEPSGSAETP